MPMHRQHRSAPQPPPPMPSDPTELRAYLVERTLAQERQSQQRLQRKAAFLARLQPPPCDLPDPSHAPAPAQPQSPQQQQQQQHASTSVSSSARAADAAWTALQDRACDSHAAVRALGVLSVHRPSGVARMLASGQLPRGLVQGLPDLEDEEVRGLEGFPGWSPGSDGWCSDGWCSDSGALMVVL